MTRIGPAVVIAAAALCTNAPLASANLSLEVYPQHPDARQSFLVTVSGTHSVGHIGLTLTQHCGGLRTTHLITQTDNAGRAGFLFSPGADADRAPYSVPCTGQSATLHVTHAGNQLGTLTLPAVTVGVGPRLIGFGYSFIGHRGVTELQWHPLTDGKLSRLHNLAISAAGLHAGADYALHLTRQSGAGTSCLHRPWAGATFTASSEGVIAPTQSYAHLHYEPNADRNFPWCKPATYRAEVRGRTASQHLDFSVPL